MSDASRRTHFYTPVSAILKHAAKRGLCNELRIERPPENDPVIRWLHKEEANRFINEGRHIKPLLIFLFYTGARINEAMHLQWADVDLARRHVQFLDTKNGDSRGVPLHLRVVDALQSIPTNERFGDVFKRADGKPYPAECRPSDRIKTVFKRACKRAEITQFRIHDTRHTWATWRYQANRDLGALMKLGGWKTIEMVMRYTHVNVDELSSTIARL
jgi:integrase